MPQLYGKIRINGKELSQYESVIVDSSDNDRKFGMKTKLEMEQGIGNTELFVKRSKDRDSLEITLFKCDDFGRPIPIQDNELFELNRLMYSKDGLSVVENHDLCYYGIFGEGTNWRNSAKQGYVTVKFEMATPTPMSRVRQDNVHVVDEQVLELINKYNAQEIVQMDIEVEMIKGSTFTIKNKLTGDTLYISDLEVGDKFRIYGDTKEIVCFNNENKNLFKSCNRQFNVLTMRYGLNNYHIVAKECKVKIIYQSQLCFQ